MNNSKIASAMMEAGALGFEFKRTRKSDFGPPTVYYEFEHKEGCRLLWDSSKTVCTWGFTVSGQGASAVDAINAAVSKAKACMSAPAE